MLTPSYEKDSKKNSKKTKKNYKNIINEYKMKMNSFYPKDNSPNIFMNKLQLRMKQYYSFYKSKNAEIK